MKMNIAVLFDGAGLARLGLEQAGHNCTGYELDPAKHYLSKMLGSGNCVLADVREVDLTHYDAIWASPPCQSRSDANENYIGEEKPYQESGLFDWTLDLPRRFPDKVIWIENVYESGGYNEWGIKFNAVQFELYPRQKRRRVIGGRYETPYLYRPYQHDYKFNICPAVLGSELHRGGLNADTSKERRKASRWYGRALTLREMAYHQGLDIPHTLLKSWFYIPPFPNPKTEKLYTFTQWRVVLSSAIGNGVPVYMAKAFGEVYSRGRKQPLFEYLERVRQ